MALNPDHDFTAAICGLLLFALFFGWPLLLFWHMERATRQRENREALRRIEDRALARVLYGNQPGGPGKR